jgi:hypothetical protein
LKGAEVKDGSTSNNQRHEVATALGARGVLKHAVLGSCELQAIARSQTMNLFSFMEDQFAFEDQNLLMKR